jgi:peptide-methionine (S)-S-oxide reductase
MRAAGAVRSGASALSPVAGEAAPAVDPAAVALAAPEPEEAVLGGGCFWCLEAVFQQLRGVEEVTSGYAGGHDPAPTYRSVCDGTTGHAEVVRIRFEPAEIPYRTLLDVFFTIHDPTTPNRQGADIGTQYRSIILYDGSDQESIARQVIREVEEESRWPGKIATEVAPLTTFHPAEAEHVDFYMRNPGQPYCQAVISPKLSRARSAFRSLFRE